VGLELDELALSASPPARDGLPRRKPEGNRSRLGERDREIHREAGRRGGERGERREGARI
jgi:hypothetical protein